MRLGLRAKFGTGGSGECAIWKSEAVQNYVRQFPAAAAPLMGCLITSAELYSSGSGGVVIKSQCRGVGGRLFNYTAPL